LEWSSLNSTSSMATMWNFELYATWNYCPL
jgi:hypothetical protein